MHSFRHGEKKKKGRDDIEISTNNKNRLEVKRECLELLQNKQIVFDLENKDVSNEYCSDANEINNENRTQLSTTSDTKQPIVIERRFRVEEFPWQYSNQ